MFGERVGLVRRGAFAGVALVRFVLVGLALAGLTACGSGDTTVVGDAPTTTAALEFERLDGERVDINVVDNTFEPRYVEVKAGTTLVFTNNGRNPHDIKAVADGVFDEVTGDQFGPGEVAEITLTKTGEIPYYCSIHGTPKNGQNGIIKVVP